MLPAAGKRIQYLVGAPEGFRDIRPRAPYNDLACDFLNNLSAALLADKEAKAHPDVIAFAYWCRKANIARLKQEFGEMQPRLGLGLAFHIAPSNVPINFAFSFAFSLLAGNANIVRVPSKDFLQTNIVCRTVKRLCGDANYEEIGNESAFVKYEQDDEITGAFSKICHARIIWGGDQTIHHIRTLPTPERCVEIAFADRYSFCVLDGPSVFRADDAIIKRLAASFYNDTYLMDQNACSSSHLVVWLGEGDVVSKAKERFWGRVHEVTAAKYDLQPVNAVDKFTRLCENAVEREHIGGFKRHGNYIYRLEIDALPPDLDTLRGIYGLFYEYSTPDLNSLASVVNEKYQTLTYFGVDKAKLLDFVLTNRLRGIDRIVPIGAALDIGVIWDGYDLVRSLSRIIECR
ncbi:MAG: acyl-CoA reductase [Pseudomonadota bacterium]|nr:acyl-CoA reductase [Pseudomonadota bacterium]